jgi:hypothetical protein
MGLLFSQRIREGQKGKREGRAKDNSEEGPVDLHALVIIWLTGS